MAWKINTVGIIGAGAIGAYFMWGMDKLPKENICLIARGERKERLEKNGVIINGERYDYPVKTPEEARGVDLLLIATKYGALPSILGDVKAVVKPETAVLSLLNGVDSEKIIGKAIGEEHMLYSIMRISSERRGNAVFFNEAVTRGLFFGEKGHRELTERGQAILEFFSQTPLKVTYEKDILAALWYKFAINVSRNLPQAILGVGTGAYDDSVHVDYISRVLYEEVRRVAAAAEQIEIEPYETLVNPRKNAHLSTLQDLEAGRHTEIDMFAGVMVEMGHELGIAVPFCDYTFHAIKALEEKNDGHFDYEPLKL